MSDSLASLYQQVILDHSRERHGFGTLELPDAARFEKNPTCGDEITVHINVGDDRITSFAWSGAGCSISQASASVLSDLVSGRTVADAREMIGEFRSMLRSRNGEEPDDKLGEAVIFQGVSRYVMRVKCAMLAWVALEACLAQLATPAGETGSAA